MEVAETAAKEAEKSKKRKTKQTDQQIRGKTGKVCPTKGSTSSSFTRKDVKEKMKTSGGFNKEHEIRKCRNRNRRNRERNRNVQKIPSVKKHGKLA